MTARRLSLVVLAAALSILVSWPAIALAAAAPTKIVMQQPTQLPVLESNPQTVMVLGATITTADGKPVSNQKVEFLMGTDILGKKWASVGTVLSDSGGVARTTFIVNKTGSYDFSAKFAGNDAYGASEAPVLKADFEATPVEGHEELTLNRIGRWVPWTGLALGIAVWAVLIYVMAQVLILVPRAARRAEHRG
jgi:hypothetical protein